MACTRQRRRRAIEEGRSVSSLSMANLPSHILMEIISRLPIKTVMAVMCVSKSLFKLVSEPCFKELYSTRAPREVFLLRIYHHENTLCIAELVFQDSCSVVAVDTKFTHVFGLPHFSVQSKYDLSFKVAEDLNLVHSCNGLLCYRGPCSDKFAVICNPITGEYVTIPGPDRKDKTIAINYTLYGLGFSSRDDRFKLLRLFWRLNVDAVPVIGEQRIRMFAEIYTFGESGSWKTVADCPDESHLSQNCTFYEGVLHWYSRSSCEILTFDTDNEKFGAINSPHFWAKEIEYTAVTRLGVIEDCLYKTASVGDCVEVWVMKEYGVQSSWIKAFSIQKDIGYSSGSYKPIKYLENGEILMLSGHQIVCYNPDTRSIRIIGSSGDLGCEAIPMRPSLVSLKVLLGDNLKTRNAKSRGAYRKLREVAVISPWLTRLRFVEHTARRLRLLQEVHARIDKEKRAHRDPEAYIREADYVQHQIQDLMKLLHLCRDIPQRTATEPPLAATDRMHDANSN